MRELLTGEDIYNHIVMQKVTDDRTIVILEGNSDCQALDPHVDESLATTLPAHSKTALEIALLLCDGNECFDRVLAIRDRDFVDVLEAPISSPNIVYTDDYDLDATMLLTGNVLERVVSAFSMRPARHRFVQENGDVAEFLIRVASVLGLARFASMRDGHSFCCDRFPVREIVSGPTGAIDRTLMAAILKSRSPHCVLTETAILEVVQREEAEAKNLRWYCSGHDLAAALSGVLQKLRSKTSPNSIEKAVRAAFSCADLATTAMFKQVVVWSERNQAPIWGCP